MVFVLGFDFVVNDNVRLNTTWSQFETPIYQYTTIDSDGYGENNKPFDRFARLLTVRRRKKKTASLFYLRRIERVRITSTTHGRFWTHEIPGTFPRVSYG
jgi:hypothetical protein